MDYSHAAPMDGPVNCLQRDKNRARYQASTKSVFAVDAGGTATSPIWRRTAFLLVAILVSTRVPAHASFGPCHMHHRLPQRPPAVKIRDRDWGEDHRLHRTPAFRSCRAGRCSDRGIVPFRACRPRCLTVVEPRPPAPHRSRHLLLRRSRSSLRTPRSRLRTFHRVQTRITPRRC